MKVNKRLIQDIAKLAKLEFDAKSTEEMKSDLEKILTFVDKLNEIDTDGVDPLIYMSDEMNVIRSDEITEETSNFVALCFSIVLS